MSTEIVVGVVVLLVIFVPIIYLYFKKDDDDEQTPVSTPRARVSTTTTTTLAEDSSPSSTASASAEDSSPSSTASASTHVKACEMMLDGNLWYSDSSEACANNPPRFHWIGNDGMPFQTKDGSNTQLLGCKFYGSSFRCMSDYDDDCPYQYPGNWRWKLEDPQPMNDATSCKGYDCDVEGQNCRKGTPGAPDFDYVCVRQPNGTLKWQIGSREKCVPPPDGTEGNGTGLVMGRQYHLKNTYTYKPNYGTLPTSWPDGTEAGLYGCAVDPQTFKCTDGDDACPHQDPGNWRWNLSSDGSKCVPPVDGVLNYGLADVMDTHYHLTNNHCPVAVVDDDSDDDSDGGKTNVYDKKGIDLFSQTRNHKIDALAREVACGCSYCYCDSVDGSILNIFK